MEHFDLVVIGSGPAGFSAAMRAIDFGKHVCIVEKAHIGGAGIMNGALTSKTMWQLSQDYAVAATVNRGYRASGLVVDYQAVRKAIMDGAKSKQYQILSQIETYAREHGKTYSLTLKYGHARFLDKNTISISRADDVETISADAFVIATGSRPREYPGIPVDQERILNSDGILNLKNFPARLMIIGSGIIGSEFAAIFSNFKQTEVHLLDRQHKVIPFEDDDVSDFVSKNLEENGVIIHHTANLRTIRKLPESLEVVLDYDDGHSKVIEVDVTLISIGRDPNTEDLGLENLGIEPDSRGYLNINESCGFDPEKCAGNIYAAGDITGVSQLYSVAEIQGRYATKAVYNKIIHPLGYINMPTLMFFKPEVAAVGLNEKILQKRKVAYKVAVYSNSLVNRAIAMRNTNGFIKIIVSDDGEDRILGMRASGPQASAFIVSIAHMMNEKNSIDEILKTIFPHPSLTEGIQECLRVLKNKSIFKPFAFPEFIRLSTWKPETEN